MPTIIEHNLLAPPIGKGYDYNKTDFLLLPVPYLLNIIEKRRKEANCSPSEIREAIVKSKEYACDIPLSSEGLFNALNDEEFNANINNKDNPFKIATAASLFEYWDEDIYELQESFKEIIW